MSGNPQLPSGHKSRYFQAAHNWLDRAESQFESGQDILAAATVMLARAEMKLFIESVETGAPLAKGGLRTRRERVRPVARILLGAAALAACLVVGIALGQAWQSPGQSPSDIHADTTPVKIVKVQQPSPVAGTPAIEPAESPQEEPVIVPEPIIVEEEIIEEPIPVADVPEPVAIQPQPDRRPVTTSIPPVSDAPNEAGPSEPGNTEPGRVEHASSGVKFNPSEIALTAARALSERMNLEETDQDQ